MYVYPLWGNIDSGWSAVTLSDDGANVRIFSLSTFIYPLPKSRIMEDT